MPRNLGFDVVTDSEVREDSFLFGEAQGRAIVAVDQDHEDDFLDLMAQSRVPSVLLGHVTQGKLVVDDAPFGTIAEAKKVYEEAIPRIMREQ